MEKMTVAIIGGTQKQTFETLGKKRGYKVEHHDGKTGGGKVEQEFRRIVNKSDIVVVITTALKHQSMWAVRELAEKLGKKFTFHDGRGASGIFDKVADLVG